MLEMESNAIWSYQCAFTFSMGNVNNIWRCLNAGFVVIYLDDISIISKTEEERRKHLKIVFDILKKHQIRLRLDKCIWGVDKTEYLGFLINHLGITPTPKYRNKILSCQQPTSKPKLLRFLGMVNWLHRFIDHLHEIIAPLVWLTHNDEHTVAFNKIKQHIE